MNATVLKHVVISTQILVKGKGEGRHFIYNSKNLTSTKLKFVIM